MIQLDPKSRKVWNVRRIGAKSWYIDLGRHVQAIARSVFLGEPRWESLERYKERQQGILGILPARLTSDDSWYVSGFSTNRSRSIKQKANNVCTNLTESKAFTPVSMILTLLDVIWIGVSVELGEFTQSLWDRHVLSILLEHCLMTYFFLEVMVHLMGVKSRSLCFRSPWFCLDAVCTAAIVVEVLVVPYTAVTPGPTPALQILRLTRMARLLKFSREVKDAATIMRGMVSGIRSAGFIWIFIAVLLYTCSVLLTTATSDHSEILRDKYFGSIGQSIVTLISCGIAMDGVADFFWDLRMHNGIFQGLVFTIFVFLTYFGLLNMLVGSFCNVAIEVALIEKDKSEIGYLKYHLGRIVECYMEDSTNQINAEAFQLIMKNADVVQTLQACGTDLDGLVKLSDVLFPCQDSEISFAELLNVIVLLRKGKPASNSEILGLQEFTKQKMDRLEELIRGENPYRSSIEVGKRCSVFTEGSLQRRITRTETEIHPEERLDIKMSAETVRSTWTRPSV
jgi:hypothetical protein